MIYFYLQVYVDQLFYDIVVIIRYNFINYDFYVMVVRIVFYYFYNFKEIGYIRFLILDGKDFLLYLQYVYNIIVI